MSAIEASFTTELIESRIGIHDSHQFEVKLDYVVQPGAKSSRYRIETYVFVPKSLGINSYTYPRELFYSDIQAYIRFKTPSVSLRGLLDPLNQQSPLIRVRGLLVEALRDAYQTKTLDAMSYELRLLGCLVRTNIRDRAVTLRRRLKDERHSEKVRRVQLKDVNDACETLLSDISEIRAAYIELRPSFSDPTLPAWIREVYDYVDEYLSLAVEYHLTGLIDTIDHLEEQIRETVSSARAHLGEKAAQEQNHRTGSGYTTVLNPGANNEHFVYRNGQLKKFVTSVLFLDIRKEREGAGLSNLVAAIAAGVAMLFATVASIFSQRWYGLNSMPFVIALVLSYILKDRLKDWLKQYFSAKMTRFLWDYNAHIEDPKTGVSIGRCREAFTVLSSKQIPPDVFAERHRSNLHTIERESKPEVVLKYEKDVELNGSVIDELHGRLHEINDIIRFNISHFLMRTDDPMRLIRSYNPQRDRVENTECPKVYHLNVVFLLRAQDAPAPVHMERVRVVLDKRGIQKLEEVR